MAAIIELEGLTKTFGKSRGVTELNLRVEEGSIIGFLGPNGAGKSTTINMLMGYTRPTSGSATVFGKDITTGSVTIHKDVGFLASDMALDGGLTGWQQLEFFGHLRGNYDKKYVRELAVRLDCNLKRKIKTLSRGNKQKVALIAALMHKPKLLLLDEPTSGLDPLIQAEFNKIVLEHKATGRSAFISSHVLSEVQELCDRMVFIRRGQIIANKTLTELTEAAPKQVRLRMSNTKFTAKLRTLKGVSALELKEKTIKFGYTGDPNKLLQLLAATTVEDLSIQDIDLENLFMEYYEDSTGARDA